MDEKSMLGVYDRNKEYYSENAKACQLPSFYQYTDNKVLWCGLQIFIGMT